MKKTFGYGRPGTRVCILTALYIAAFAVVAGIFWTSGWTQYTRTILSAMLFAAGLLLVLSIPTRIELTEHALDLKCIVDMTHIPTASIRSVRRLERREMRFMFPILASYGFFGYYGYYLNLRTGRLKLLYCSTWDNFIEITDIYEKIYIISCSDPDSLVRAIAGQ